MWYNAYPAKVFMGDTGSLTIGGNHCNIGHCITERIIDTHSLRNILNGEPVCRFAGGLF